MDVGSRRLSSTTASPTQDALRRARLISRLAAVLFGATILVGGGVLLAFGCGSSGERPPRPAHAQRSVCRRKLTLTEAAHRRLVAPVGASDACGKCRITFNQVREDKRQCAYGCCKCVQLAEVSFVATERSTGRELPLNVSSIANPGGRSPPGQGPGSAVDRDVHTKWIDMALPEGYSPGPFGSSILELEFEPPPNAADLQLSAYSFTVANDASWRDPVGWHVRCW